MFVQDFVYVARPFDQVRDKLKHDASEWVRDAGLRATESGGDMRLRIGPGRGRLSSKSAHVFVGSPYERARSLVVPVSWVATGPSVLFPCLEADLEVWPLDAKTCRLGLSGMYEPPLGVVGKAMDKVVLHHVAEATVRNFLDLLATELENTASDVLPLTRSVESGGA